MFVVSNGLTVWSVQYLPSGLGAVLGAIAPVWIAVFSLILFRDTKLNAMALLGLVLGLGGIAIIFSDHLRDMADRKFTLGIVMGMVGTMAWALGTLFTVRHARDLNPYYSLGWQMFLSGLILNLLSLITGLHVPYAEIDYRAWLSIAYLVVVGSIITFTAFIYTLKRLPAAQASVYAYINPIVAVIIGALLNHEELNGYIAVGTAVTLIGVYLVNTGFKKAGVKEG
jgi:drug/metabolite transporter (DMT)-like permease